MILISDLQYFPPIILIKTAIEISHIKFDIYEEYRKMSFRNRCVVAGGAGPINLSVPLLGGRNQRRPMIEVEIDNKSDWQGQHWKTITSCYNRSPWFEFYKHELEELYKQRARLLVDWNLKCWEWVMAKLDAGIHWELARGPEGVSSTSSAVASGTMPGSQDAIMDGEAHPGITEETARSQVAHLSLDQPGEFLDWRCKLMPRSINNDFPEPVRYRQVFEERIGFIPHLSILDLLFCEGKRSVDILRASKLPS